MYCACKRCIACLQIRLVDLCAPQEVDPGEGASLSPSVHLELKLSMNQVWNIQVPRFFFQYKELSSGTDEQIVAKMRKISRIGSNTQYSSLILSTYVHFKQNCAFEVHNLTSPFYLLHTFKCLNKRKHVKLDKFSRFSSNVRLSNDSGALNWPLVHPCRFLL